MIYTVPDSIDSSGKDVSRELVDFFAQLPDAEGTEVRFRDYGKYNCEDEPRIEDKNLILDFRGAELFADGVRDSAGTFKRKQLHVFGGTIELRNGRIRGPHHNRNAPSEAYLESHAYVQAFEWQHGVACYGVKRVVLDNFHISDIYGDPLNCGDDPRVPPDLAKALADAEAMPKRTRAERAAQSAREKEARAAIQAPRIAMQNWSEGVRLLNGSRLERCGRQLLALQGCRDFRAEDSYIGWGRRAVINMEPNGLYDGVEDATFTRMTFGRSKLLFLSSVGRAAPVRRVSFVDNRLEGTSLDVYVKAGDRGIREDFRFEKNVSDRVCDHNPLMRFRNVHGIWIEANYNAMKEEGPALLFEGCSGVNVVDEAAQFPVT